MLAYEMDVKVTELGIVTDRHSRKITEMVYNRLVDKKTLKMYEELGVREIQKGNIFVSISPDKTTVIVRTFKPLKKEVYFEKKKKTKIKKNAI